MSIDRFVRVAARTAEEAVRWARTVPEGTGFALDVDLLALAGPGLVAALDEHGPVIHLPPINGPAERIGAAVRRLARYGAAWVVVAASSGVESVQAAADAVAGTGCGIAVATLPPHVDDTSAHASHGASRGKVVARMAKVGASGGATGVIATPADIGVVAAAAGELACLVEVTDAGEAAAALTKGAAALIGSAETLDRR